MRLQVLSDLHLETEGYSPVPAPQAELLVLAGDIDSTWRGLERFRGWPVPVLYVAGNHEFDAREWRQAWPALRERCASLGLQLLECESQVRTGADGRRIRFVATTRWCDFDAFGPDQRARCQRAGGYFVRVMRATLDGAPFDAAAVREQGLRCRAWLAQELPRRAADAPPDQRWDATVAVTHFAPSLASADPRYGQVPATASFCNADDDLLPHADLWIHGHLHCCHDYTVAHAQGRTRVLSNARGHGVKGEGAAHQPGLVVEV
jgi:hypothetical protein